jgi:hypothetical protein
MRLPMSGTHPVPASCNDTGCALRGRGGAGRRRPRKAERPGLSGAGRRRGGRAPMHALKPEPKKGVDTRTPNELELYDPEYTVLSLVSWSGCAPVTSCARRASSS